MAITIKHLEGPLTGREQHFDDSVAVIQFGRSPECQVVYPPELVEVGRKHFELRRVGSGDYVVELWGRHYVEIDGIQAENGSPLASASVVRLGHNGPTFLAEIEGAIRKATLPTSRKMADIAWSSEDEAAYADFADPIGEQRDGLVDLLVRRKAEAPAVTAGIPAEIVALSVPGQAHPYAESAPRYSPQAERREYASKRHRRSGLIWWVAIALGAAVIGYLLYRREIILGAALGKLLPAAAPPPPAPRMTRTDLVDVSVFGPTSIQAGGEGLIQVFLHTLGQREVTKALATEADPEATRRGVQTLAAEIARGQHVEIVLEGRGFGVDQEMQTLLWRGEPCACQLMVTAPPNATGRTFHPRVLVLIDSVPVGSLTFALKVSEGKTAATELRGDRARRYSYAFLSYASPDRAEVIKRAQGLKAGGTSFFNDVLSLEPGERWEKRLYEEIDRCDVFYLFWSTQAKASEWVLKETEYALARRAASAEGTPDIIPVIIEGPPPPTPPEALKDIHFNDSLIFVLAGVEAARTANSSQGS